VNPVEAVQRWAEVWTRGWLSADVDAIAALYSRDAVFFSHPFRPRQAPREYVAWAFGDEDAVECRFGTPIVAGDRAAVDWWAVLRSKEDGALSSIAGTSLLRFDAHGLVVEQRDAWGEATGRAELADWAR
jgi:ketosteroid isomerase-like protein